MSTHKIFLILVSAFFIQSITAQPTTVYYPKEGKIISDNDSRGAVPRLNEINMRALRHVAKEYSNPEKQFWTATKQGYRVKFEEGSVVYWIDYYKNGAWRNTLMSYKVDHAPQNVLWALKGYLKDYNISQVSELRYGNTTAYFVNLEGYKSLKTIRIIDGELELVSNFKKGVGDSQQIAYGTK